MVGLTGDGSGVHLAPVGGEMDSRRVANVRPKGAKNPTKIPVKKSKRSVTRGEVEVRAPPKLRASHSHT